MSTTDNRPTIDRVAFAQVLSELAKLGHACAIVQPKADAYDRNTRVDALHELGELSCRVVDYGSKRGRLEVSFWPCYAQDACKRTDALRRFGLIDQTYYRRGSLNDLTKWLPYARQSIPVREASFAGDKINDAPRFAKEIAARVMRPDLLAWIHEARAAFVAQLDRCDRALQLARNIVTTATRGTAFDEARVIEHDTLHVENRVRVNLKHGEKTFRVEVAANDSPDCVRVDSFDTAAGPDALVAALALLA